MNTILFWCPDFFDYQSELAGQLIKMGYDVQVVTDRPFRSKVLQGLTTKFPTLISIILIARYKWILRNNKNGFDLLMVINGQTLSPRLLRWMETKFSFNRKIIYLWDSMKNRPTVKKIIPFFDEVFSFDAMDCRAHNFNYRPLFYTNKKTDIPNEASVIKSRAAFIGTDHGDRGSVLSEFISLNNQLSVEAYLYYHSPLIFFLKKYLLFQKIPPKGIKRLVKPMSRAEIDSIYEKSEFVLDIEHPNQTGLTMRTIELIGMNKKIITTNEAIRSEPFFSPDMIYIINRENPIVEQRWIGNRSKKGFNETEREQLSIIHFIDDLLDDK